MVDCVCLVMTEGRGMLAILMGEILGLVGITVKTQSYRICDKCLKFECVSHPCHLFTSKFQAALSVSAVERNNAAQP